MKILINAPLLAAPAIAETARKLHVPILEGCATKLYRMFHRLDEAR